MTDDLEATTLANGDIVAGRYELEGLVGEGGMAFVYSARHLHLDERYAIKVLRPSLSGDREVVERFLQEARAVAQLRSDHTCRVFDVGLLADRRPFIVMELLTGEDLREHARRIGQLPVEEAVEIVIQACEALAEAHAVGLVHRDIKPENLYLTRRPDGWRSVKLLDFGVAKILSSDGPFRPSAREETRRLMITPAYSAPEELLGSKDIDARSDLWSLGIVLHELLAGSAPFGGASVNDVVRSVLETEPRSLMSSRPDVPPELAAIIESCMVKARELRVTSAAELAVQLLPFAPRRSRAVVERMQSLARSQGEIVNLPPSMAPPPHLDPSDSTVVLPLVEGPRETRKGALVWGLAIAAAFVIAAGITWEQQRRQRAPEPSSPTAAPTVAPTAAAEEPSPMAPTSTPALPVAPPVVENPAEPAEPEPTTVREPATPRPVAPPNARRGPAPNRGPEPAREAPKPAGAPAGVTWDKGPDVGF